MQDLTLILSLMSLGFFGGFSHCIGMCGPFVITQVTNNLSQTPLDKFSQLQKLKNLALIPYHLGRITSYAIIGFCCAILRHHIEDYSNFKIISTIFIVIAIIFFAQLLFNKKNFQTLKLPFKIKFPLKIKLPFKSIILKNSISFIQSKIAFLFKNPRGFKGYLLGIFLGFIPCGLLYGAFLIAATMQNPIFGAIGMIFFGLATFPSLFLTACGGGFLTKIPEFKIFAKLVILINIAALILLALKLNFN